MNLYIGFRKCESYHWNEASAARLRGNIYMYIYVQKVQFSLVLIAPETQRIVDIWFRTEIISTMGHRCTHDFATLLSRASLGKDPEDIPTDF